MVISTTYTYLGTADDVVLRYPWKNGISKSSIEDQLIFSAIYDNKLAINDGYVVANKILLPSLLDRDKGILSNLLESESAMLFSRGDPQNIANGIEKSAKIIETHRQIVEDDKRWPDIIKSLDSLQITLKKNSIKWPNLNMGAIFYKTFERLFSMDRYKLSIPENLQSVFENIFNNFSKEINQNFDGARDLWESTVWRYFYPKEFRSNKFNPFSETLTERKWYPQIKVLMQAANEAYHIAYTCALDDSLSHCKGSTIVKPMTALCPAYQDLFKEEEIEANDSSHFDHICKYTIPIYYDMFKKDASFRWISSLKRDENIGSLRSSYLEEFNEFIKNQSNEKVLKIVRDDYLNAILNECSNQFKESFLQKHLGKLMWSTGASIPSVAAYTSGLGAELQVAVISYFAGYYGVNIFEKFVKLSNIRNNKNLRIKNILRDSGLVNAPLNSDVVAKYLKDIKPYGMKQNIIPTII